MAEYRLFARVSVYHDYFADGRARHLRFRADPDTQAFLDRFALLARCDGRSLLLFAAGDQLAGMWSERLDAAAARTLRFELSSDDSLCADYTDPEGLPGRFVPDAEARLQPVAAAMQAGKSWRLPGLGELVLPFNAAGAEHREDWEAGLGGDYRLELRARQTIWKYLLLGDWPAQTLRLVDAQARIDFSTADPEDLPDGRRALAIRSLAAIALSERPPQRFQLRDSGRTPEKVLIPRLPAAAPGRLRRELWRGEPTTVSEIFVNR